MKHKKFTVSFTTTKTQMENTLKDRQHEIEALKETLMTNELLWNTFNDQNAKFEEESKKWNDKFQVLETAVKSGKFQIAAIFIVN